MSPLDAMHLLAESREHPMHVAALQLFTPPQGAGRRFARDTYEAMLASDHVQPAFRKHPSTRARRDQQPWLVLRRRYRLGLPRAALGVARAGPRSRPPRIDLPPARQPARSAPAVVGSTPHRGSARRTIRGVHQAASRTGRRRLRTAAHTALIEHRSDRQQDPGAMVVAVPAHPAPAPTPRRGCAPSREPWNPLPGLVPQRCRWAALL